MAIRGDLALSTFEGRLRLRGEPTSGLGDVELNEVTAPGTPAANRIRLYAKDQSAVSALFYKNDAGTEINLSGSLTGTGVANRIAFWSDTTVLSSDADLTFLTDTLTATKIVVTNANTAGSVLFVSATGVTQDNPSFFYVDADNDLVLGSTSVPDTLIKGRGLYVARAGSQAACTLFSHGNIGLQGNFNVVIPRGTLAAPSATQSGDGIGFLVSGHDNSAYTTQAPAAVFLVAAEAWTSIAHGSDIRLGTTALGTTSRGERFRIGPSGQWGIGGATYGTAGQYKRSGGAAAAPTWATIAASEIGSGAAVTAASTKITLAGSPSAAALAAFSIDVAEANLTHNNLGGLTTGDPHTQYLLKAGGTMTGNLLFTDNLYDIGANGATRPRDLWLSRNLMVTGVGPHAIGGATAVNTRLDLKGDFTGSTATTGMVVQGLFTGPVNGNIIGVNYTADMASAASGIHALITQLRLGSAGFVANGAAVTTLATLYIEGVGSGASNNYSLFIDGGLPRIDSTATAGAGAGTILTTPNAGGGNPAVWMKLDVNGTSYAFPGWAL